MQPDHRRSKENIMKVFPKREIADFLIKYFLEEVNWLYEVRTVAPRSISIRLNTLYNVTQSPNILEKIITPNPYRKYTPQRF